MNINSVQQQPTTFKSKVNRSYEALSVLKGLKSKNGTPFGKQIKSLENNGIPDLVFIGYEAAANDGGKLIMQVIRDAGGNKGYKGVSEVLIGQKSNAVISLTSMYNDAVKNLNTPISRYKELSALA